MKFISKILLITLVVISGSFLFNNCATVSRPEGGPMDTVPPVIVFTDPPMYTTNFDEKHINIGFNEYVKLNQVEKELIVSPPLKKNPKIWIKKKGIYFELNNEELIDSATYIFNFGNSVVDNNEGNPYVNLSYVFSTGPKIDSFGISGVIVDAFTLQPSKEPFSILLYNNLHDTMPLTTRPTYVGRSLQDGSYSIEHIKPGKYRLFALKESNANFIYDQPNEQIGFVDSIITFDPDYFEFENTIINENDSIISDSLYANKLSADSLQADFADHIKEKHFKIYGIHQKLVSFIEQSNDTLQYLKSSGYVDNRMLYFSFNRPVTDSFKVVLQYFPGKIEQAIPEFSINKDSINYWITDTSLLNMDTLNIILTYEKPDSMFNPVIIKDTLKFRRSGRALTGQRRRLFANEKEEKKQQLEPEFNIGNNRKMELNDSLQIDFKTPLAVIDTNRINFYIKDDSLFIEQPYRIIKDSIKLSRLHFQFKIEETLQYRIEILDSAFIDIYGLTNDTIEHNFTTKSMEQYGELQVNMEGVDGNIVVQLLNSKEKIVDYAFINENSSVTFSYLNPAEYKLKVIYDTNHNKQWDTGNYLKKIQPERVAYFETSIKVRANWDHVENWDLNPKIENTEPKTITEKEEMSGTEMLQNSFDTETGSESPGNYQ